MASRAAMTFLICVALVGCGEDQAAAPQPTTPSTPTETPTPTPTPTADPAPGPRSDTPLPERMEHHFDQATRARDALVRGDLEAARTAARELAALEPTAEQPAPWAPHYEGMRAAARRTAEGADLDAVTLAFGDLATSCGTCHAAVGASITWTAPQAPTGTDTATHMQRHQWALDRMWEGLVIPDVARFTVGSGALVEAPLHPSAVVEGQTVPTEINALAERTHALGRNASVATDDATRSRLYGELLRTCSECHRSPSVAGAAAQ